MPLDSFLSPTKTSLDHGDKQKVWETKARSIAQDCICSDHWLCAARKADPLSLCASIRNMHADRQTCRHRNIHTRTYRYIALTHTSTYIHTYMLNRLCNQQQVPGLQGCKFLGFQVSKIPWFQASKFQGPWFQVPRFQTCKHPGLIHQQRNDQSHAKQPPNTIDLHVSTDRSKSQLHKNPKFKVFKVVGLQPGQHRLQEVLD